MLTVTVRNPRLGSISRRSGSRWHQLDVTQPGISARGGDNIRPCHRGDTGRPEVAFGSLLGVEELVGCNP
jgi:hypothetical protein